MDLRVLRIVVASPGDVKPERDTVSKVVDEVNRTIGRERHLALEVHRWETDSHPGFHPQGPQGLIDPILEIEDCDLLIGIFWRRFGKPVSDAKSGTEHEFRIAYKTWQKKRKPKIMMYFSQKKYFAQTTEETVQAGLVLQFKKDFPPEGLWCDYKNKAEFEGFLRNHLTQFLQEQSPIDIKSGRKQLETSPLTPLFQLPPPPADFTGRTAELAELRAAIEKGGVHISGLQGQGGVGKTALALKLAAELAPNYPDAQIYLDLKGVSEKPLTAAEAMSHVLRTFHPEAKLPETVEELSGLYHSVLHGRRALLLMDNAKDAAQVQPLIPQANCALLITSRYRFAVEGLHARNLDTLPPEDARSLLLRIAPRIAGEAEAIAELCGYLALALRLAATALSERIDLAPASYRKKLTDEKQRLKLLGGDKGIEASITLSYNLLDVETQKRWRMLAVFPGTFLDIAPESVWDTGTDAAKHTLSHLVQHSLLEWNDANERYRLHDLMRDFASQQLTPVERHLAGLRHATHFLAVLETAGELYNVGGGSVMRSLSLFDLEWGNIRAGQSWAADHSAKDLQAARLCNAYPGAGHYCLTLRLGPREEVQWLAAALKAAHSLEDRAAEGQHLTGLGNVLGDLGEARYAVECLEMALTIFRDTGNRQGEGAALGNLGNAYFRLGELRRSIEYNREHLSISREVGDRQGESNALGNLGAAYGALGEIPQAVEYLEQRLSVARDIGDRKGEGSTLGNLGTAYAVLNQTDLAVEYFELSLAIKQEIGDRRGESNTLGNLGNVYIDKGKTGRAIEYYERQLEITREIGFRTGEGGALWNLSLALDKLGDRNKVIEHAEAALQIYEESEDPRAADMRKQLEIWRNG